MTIASPALAVWPHDPTVGNVPLCTATGNQQNVACIPDGVGGAILTWHDSRTGGFDIYAQRVSAAGIPMWGPNGVPVCTVPGDQQYPVIVSDGAGGAIIAWIDFAISGNSDIYAQRLNAAGASLWPTGGVAVCTAPNNQGGVRMASDGAGGAIAAWNDNRTGLGNDIYVQRLNPAGTPQWVANGVAICVAVGDQYPSSIISDGAGGAIMAWDDNRIGSNYDIYGQRVNSAGFVLWATNGAAICTALSDQSGAVLASDGAGGAIAAWADNRNGNSDIFAQRIHATGAALWPVNGVVVCNANLNQSGQSILSDGSGGAIVAWNDNRVSSFDIYAQHLNSNGVNLWPANGVALCAAPLDQSYPVLVSDGSGGAIAAWGDGRNGANDIFAQRVTGSGTVMWSPNGVAVSTAAYGQVNPTIVPDGSGNAIVLWQDLRNGLDYDVYGQRVDKFGYLGAEPVIASVRDVPNDQGGRIKLSWYPSWLDGASDPNLAAYDVYRSAPGSMAMAAIHAGARRLSGFAEMPAPGERAFVIDPARNEAYAWEFLATIAPTHFLSEYGYIASTTGDSVGGSNPLTAFMVVGRNPGGSMYWLSAPDSGYSVDNLPPGAPAPFAGTYSSGSTAMHWRANNEADLANYRLYRGTTANFVPSPSNRIASPSDTLYTDAAGQPFYYKLSAVDAHGNESGFTLLIPNGTTAVDGGTPMDFALAGAVPNPAVRFAEIRFTLPREANAMVRIVDASGRLVRVLSSARLSAGPHALHWDGARVDGSPAAPGLYFVSLESEGRALTRRMALMR